MGCMWCHNPEGQSINSEFIFRPDLCIDCLACIQQCEQEAISAQNGSVKTDRSKCILCSSCIEVCYSGAREIIGKEMTVAEVITEIKKDIQFYDESGGGVTFSGGEPLSQPGFLKAMLIECKQLGIHSAIETCGFVPWSSLEEISEHTDLFLYDLKTLDNKTHQAYTGVSNEIILDNISRLSELGNQIIIRVPLIPGVNDHPESLHEFGEFVSSLPQVYQLDLLPYHNAGIEKYKRLNRPYHLNDVQSASKEHLDSLAEYLSAFGINVNVGA